MFYTPWTPGVFFTCLFLCSLNISACKIAHFSSNPDFYQLLLQLIFNNYFFGQLCCCSSGSCSSKFFPYTLIKWCLRTSCQNIHPSNPPGASESRYRDLYLWKALLFQLISILYNVCWEMLFPCVSVCSSEIPVQLWMNLWAPRVLKSELCSDLLGFFDISQIALGWEWMSWQ